MSPSTPLFSNPRVLWCTLIILLAFNSVLAMWFFSGDNRMAESSVQPPIVFRPKPFHPTNAPQPTSIDKIAMIIETRMVDNLVPLILHFSMVLGPSWQVVLFTMENVWEMPQSPAFRRAIQQSRVRVQFMPPETSLKKWKNVSRFLAKPWIWEQVQSASRVLMFQMDSIICGNSNRTIDDFLEWDFIGAPVNPFLGKGFNGGLSLRNPKMILEILASPRNNFEELWRTNQTGQYIEDQFYYTRMAELSHARLPDIEVAKQFSVESLWYDRPLGYHAPRLWNPDRMNEIWEYCPEVELTSKEKKVLFVDLTEEN